MSNWCSNDEKAESFVQRILLPKTIERSAFDRYCYIKYERGLGL
jgi:hypothetical protein